MAHTPGPWHIDTEDGGARILDDDELIIAGIYGFSAPDRDGQEDANARLIAAAPDLLAALKGLLESIQDVERETNTMYGTLDGALADARAAIAKAESK